MGTQNRFMSCQQHNRDSDHIQRRIQRVTLWGLLVNIGLCVVKAICGWIGSSQSLIADAVHSLSDTSTDIALLVGVRYWSAPPDDAHPHGHARIENLVSLFIGVVLASVGLGLTWHALSTLHQYRQGPVAIPGWAAFVAACLSVVIKEGLYRWTARVGRRVHSSALVANAWHHRSDALSSIPVAVAVLGSRLQPTWSFLDHVATVLVSMMILNAAWSIAQPAFSVLIDAGACKKDRETLLAMALEIKGVREVHKLRTRIIGRGLQLDLHVLVDANLPVYKAHDIATQVERHLVSNGPDVLDAVVHIEPYHQSSGSLHRGLSAGPSISEPKNQICNDTPKTVDS